MSHGQKAQFYKPSVQQQRQMVFSNVKIHIDQTQENIYKLLNKYRQVVPEQSSPKHDKKQMQKGLKSSRNAKESPIINQRDKKQISPKQKVKQAYLKLPKVNQKSRPKPQTFAKHKSKSFMENNTKQPYSTIVKDEAKGKKRVNKSVFDKYRTIEIQGPAKNEARFQQKQQFINQQNDFQKYFMKQMVLKMDKDIQFEVQNSDVIYDMSLGISKPLQYRRPQRKNQQNDSQDSNQETQIPVTHYQRQLKQTIQRQSLDELNFLYFSKSQSMKDWTKQLFKMFEKDNKEVDNLKKKCKFLETFDQSYFTADVYRQK